MPAGSAHDGGQRSPANMVELDFSPDNLLDEIDGDGWLDTNRPVGLGPLNKLPTIGGRGVETKDLRSDTRSDPRQ